MSNHASVASDGLRQRRAAELRAAMTPKNGSRTHAAVMEEDEASPPNEPESDAADAVPVGEGEHVVKQGECVSSIAKDQGYFWQAIWDHPANADLKAARKDPNVLLPDDRVVLPDKTAKNEPGQTELRHRFVRRGEPSRLRLRVLDEDDAPLANQPYTLEVDGHRATGHTDPDGKLEQPVAGNARRAILTVGVAAAAQVHHLQLGALDPTDSISGVQSRLANLGYDLGATDGEIDDGTRAALAAFQQSRELPPTGELDEATRARLRERHGS